MTMLDPALEDQLLAAKNLRGQIMGAAAVSTPPAQAQMLGDYQKTFPWMSPGVSYSLAKSGVPPTDPLAFQASQQDMTRLAYANQTRAAIYGDPSTYDKPAPAPGDPSALPDTSQGPALGSAGTMDPTNPSGRLINFGVPPPAMSKKLVQARSGVKTAIQGIQSDLEAYNQPGSNTTDATKLLSGDAAHALFGAKTVGDAKALLSNLQQVATSNDPSVLQKYAAPINKGYGQFVNQTYKQSQQGAGGTSVLGVTAPGVLGSLLTPDVSADLHALSTGAKGISRLAAGAAQFPLQAGQAMVREVAGGHSIPTPLGPIPIDSGAGKQTLDQTTLGQIVDQSISGKPVDLGQGWLPSPTSPIEEARAAVARQAAPTIGGHAFTVGRGLAAGIGDASQAVLGHNVLEPDTPQFSIASGLIDAAATLKLDPTANILQGVGENNINATGFGDHGLYIGAHPIVDAEKIGNWWNVDEDAQALKEHLAGESSPFKIWVRTKGRIPVQTTDGTPLLQQVAQADTPEAIHSLLAPYLGTDIQKAPGWMGNFGYTIAKGPASSRWWGSMPSGPIDTNDPTSVVQGMDRWGQSVGLSFEQREAAINRYVNNPQGLGAFEHLTDMAKQAMVLHGTPEDIADQATRIFVDSENRARAYYTDTLGREVDRPGVVIDGRGNVLPSPHVSSEWLHGPVTMPDVREIRSATGTFAPLWTNPAIKMPKSLLEAFTTNIWTRAKLIHEGLLTRIFGDTQLSAAAHGYASVTNDPTDWMSAIVGTSPESRWAKVFSKVPGVEPSFGIEAGGAQTLDMADPDLQRQVLNGAYEYLSPSKIATHDTFSMPLTAENLTGELGQMATADEVKLIARASSPGQAQELFWNSPIRDQLQSYAETRNASGLQQAAEQGGTYRPIDLTTRAGSDAYVSSILDRIATKTGGDARLVSALANNDLDGVQLIGPGGRVTDEAISKVQEIIDAGDVNLPATAKQRGFLSLTAGSKGAGAMVSHMYDRLMHALVFGHDEILDRSPMYAQINWKHSVDLAPFADEATRARILQSADEANLPDELMGRLQGALKSPVPENPIDMSTLRTLAKGRALDELPGVIHDTMNKSNAGDILRMLFPFGDAQRRILTRWASTAWQNPNVPYRFQQGVSAAEAPNDLWGGQGFFHKDPVTGQEVFSYPMSGAITQATLGVPIPLTGQVSGLNMASQGLPGVGPAITIPAAYLLPDSPATDWVRKIIFPFGANDTGNPAYDIANQVEPTFLNKFTEALSPNVNPRRYADTVGAIIKYLASTGAYDIHGPNAGSENQRLVDDAKSKAQWFSIIRGAAQFLVPSAPAPQFMFQDKSGKLLIIAKVADEYRQEATKNGPDAALQHLANKYGVNSLFIPQSYQTPLTYGLPVTKQGWDWVRTNPEAKAQYPDTFGFFAPSTGKFDITAFSQQLDEGLRQPLSGDQMDQQANNRIGLYLYHKQRDGIVKQNGGTLPDTGQNAWLSKYRTALEADYPGFDLTPFDQRKLPRQINQLVHAAADPKLASNSAVQGLKIYLEFRKRANSQAVADGYTSKTGAAFGKAQAAKPIRDWLRNAAQAVIHDFPDFGPMYEQVLSHEMTTDGQ